jgi:hypothetical protein
VIDPQLFMDGPVFNENEIIVKVSDEMKQADRKSDVRCCPANEIMSEQNKRRVDAVAGTRRANVFAEVSR